MSGGVEKGVWRRKEQRKAAQGFQLEPAVALSEAVFLLLPSAPSFGKIVRLGRRVWPGSGCRWAGLSFSLIPFLLIPIYLLIRRELFLSLDAGWRQSGFVAMATSQVSSVRVPLPFKGNERLRSGKLLSGSTPFCPSLKGVESGDAGVFVVRVRVVGGEDGPECVQCYDVGGVGRSGCLVAARAPREWPLQTLISPSLKQGRLRNLFLWGGLCWEGENRC